MAEPIDLSTLETLVKSLNESLDTVAFRLDIATAAVVIGLLIEYAEDARKVFWALVNGVTNRNLNSFRALEGHVKSAVLGGVLITVGVGAELWYGYRASAIDSALQTANGQIVAFLNGKARAAELATQGLKTEAEKARAQAEGFRSQIADADARVKLAEGRIKTAESNAALAAATVRMAGARIADAQRGIATANRAAEEARSMASRSDLARAELEARIAPRTLDASQRAFIGNALRVFAKSLFARQVRLEWQSIDIEATIFGVEIKDALSKAGIQSDGPTVGLSVGGPVIIGLTITGPTKDTTFVRSLYALLNTYLPKESISAETGPKFEGKPVTVTVGFKTPQGLDTLPQSVPAQR